MSSQPSPRLLVIEDDADAADLMIETLRDHFRQAAITRVADAAAARAVDPRTVDLVLSDMNLPDGTGLEVLRHYLSIRPDLPVVFVTGENILENAIEAVRRGAYDYVVKAGDYLFSVPVVVEKNLELWRIKRDHARLQQKLAEALEEVNIKNEQLRQAVARLETMAATDPLTGLANRRSINKSLDGRFAEAARGPRDLAVIMLDLDGFKQLNDAAGHPAGDRVLIAAARALEANCRRSDLPGRFGGDEFIVVLPGVDREEGVAVAERISRDFAAHTARLTGELGHPVAVTMSMGVAAVRTSGARTADQLLQHADQALYAAKNRGKRCVVAFEPAVPASRGVAA